METLDTLYDFVDFLKYKNDIDDITLSVLRDIRKEYRVVKQSVSGRLSGEEVVKKLTFVMNCEYQNMLRRFLEDKENLKCVVQDQALLRMLTESIVEVSEQPELRVEPPPEAKGVITEEKGVQKESISESHYKTDKSRSIDDGRARSQTKEMQQLLVNKYIRSFSYHLQKMSMMSKTGRLEDVSGSLVDRLVEFEESFDQLNEYDDVALDEDNVKNVETINAIVNSRSFNALLDERPSQLSFCRKFQTFALRIALNNADERNQLVIKKNPDIEQYMSLKGSEREKEYSSSRNLFPYNEPEGLRFNEKHKTRVGSLPADPSRAVNLGVQYNFNKNVKEANKPEIFSSFFEKHRKSRFEDSKPLEYSNAGQGNNISPLVHLKARTSSVNSRDELLDERTEDIQPKATTKPEANLKQEFTAASGDTVDAWLVADPNKQIAVRAGSNPTSPIDTARPNTPNSKDESFNDTRIDKNILYSELNKTSKVSFVDPTSEPNSKNVSQDKETINTAISEAKTERRNQQEQRTPDEEAQRRETTRSTEASKKVDPSIVNSFRDLEVADIPAEKRRDENEDNDKSDELDEFELESYFGKDLQSKILSKYGLSQENIFKQEEKQETRVAEAKAPIAMKQPIDRNAEYKVDVSRSMRTNHTENSGFDTVGYRGSNFEIIMSQKLNLMQEAVHDTNVFTREFNKLIEKFKRSHYNTVECGKPSGYIDPTFQPVTASILDEWGSEEHKHWRLFEWRRISSIYPSDHSIVFNNEGAQLLDASASNLDLLTVLLSLQRYESRLVDTMIQDHRPSIGKFAIRSLADGKITYLDDFLPVKMRYNCPETATPLIFPFIAPQVESGEINVFFSVIEKFCARMTGSYQTLQHLCFDELIRLFSSRIEQVDLTMVRGVDKKLMQNFLMDLYDDFKDECRVIYFVKHGERAKFCKFIKRDGFEFLLEDFSSQVNLGFNEICDSFDAMVVASFNL